MPIQLDVLVSLLYSVGAASDAVGMQILAATLTAVILTLTSP